MTRTASISRQTKETRIELALDLDNPSEGLIQTGSGFLDHMLDLFRKHGRHRAETVFTPDAALDQYEAVYREVIG